MGSPPQREGREGPELQKQGVTGEKGCHSLHLWPREDTWGFVGLVGLGEQRVAWLRMALPSPASATPSLPLPTAGVWARLSPGAGGPCPGHLWARPVGRAELGGGALGLR